MPHRDWHKQPWRLQLVDHVDREGKSADEIMAFYDAGERAMQDFERRSMLAADAG